MSFWTRFLRELTLKRRLPIDPERAELQISNGSQPIRKLEQRDRWGNGRDEKYHTSRPIQRPQNWARQRRPYGARLS